MRGWLLQIPKPLEWHQNQWSITDCGGKMFHESLTDLPANADDFWKAVEENFDHAKIVMALPLQTKEEALLEDHIESIIPYCIPFRGASVENDQRAYFYDLGNAQIEPLTKLIRERTLTPEFAHRWGVLMCSFGHTVNYVMDDSRVLVSERAAASSAEKRNLLPQRVWLAHVMQPYAKGWGNRREGEKVAVDLIKKVIAKGGWGEFNPDWFTAMLSPKKAEDGKRQLKSAFRQNKFSVKEMEEAIAEGVENIPPIEETFLLSGKR